MARRRNLHPDEEDLWQAVARTARPLHPKLQPKACLLYTSRCV